MEALQPVAAAFHERESAAERKKEPADAELLGRATRLEHELRDWVAVLLPAPDIGTLRRAGILASQDKLEVYRPPGFADAIVVRLGLHVPGGMDSGAWLFEKRVGKWVQTLSLERNQQKTASFLDGLEFSPADKSGSRLMIAVRTPAGASGCWHPASYQLYRVGTPTPPPLLLDDWHAANLCKGPPRVKAEAGGFSIELEDRDLQPGTTRTHILRYEVTAEHARRVQPVALKPREFVDEWLEREWREAVDWTAPQARGALEKVHQELHPAGQTVSGEYRSAEPCGGAGQWEIGLDLVGHGTRYFRVRELGNNGFQMVSAGGSGCATR
jgi:hypothetical protein